MIPANIIIRLGSLPFSCILHAFVIPRHSASVDPGKPAKTAAAAKTVVGIAQARMQLTLMT